MGGNGEGEAGASRWGIAPPGYRLPADIRLGPVRLQVADLDRSVAYYGHVLGLRVLDRHDRSAKLGVSGGGAPLIELNELRGAVSVPQGGRLGLYHFAVLLPDRAALGRFITHLSDLGVRAGMSDHAVSEAVYLSDPDGLGIEVYADRPRSRWPHEARQLQMTTAPLDVAAVVRAAASARWTEMPAGTALGHVHLFVGDLDEAAAFYHVGLGLDKVVWSYPGALFLSAGGYHHHLGVNTWAAGARPAGPADARLLDWTVLLPRPEDADAAAGSMAAAGYTVGGEPGRRLVTDPWGTALRLLGGA